MCHLLFRTKQNCIQEITSFHLLHFINSLRFSWLSKQLIYQIFYWIRLDNTLNFFLSYLTVVWSAKMSSKDISCLILRIQFLFYYFLSIQGFSLESKEEIFLVPSENSKLKIGFGESFIIKKQGNYTKWIQIVLRLFWSLG